MFYGWKIVGVTWVTQFISVGFIFYSYGVFLVPIAAELNPQLDGETDTGRFAVSMGLAVMSLATGIFAPFLGKIVDHRPIRNVMCIGAVVLALGFFGASLVNEIWQFYCVLAMVGLGAAMIGGLPGTTLVANWFIRRRGMAMGISTMGVSMAGMFMAPICAYAIMKIGWRLTFDVYGVVTLCVVLPFVIRYVVNTPEDMGLTPDGEKAPDASLRQDAPEPMLPLGPGDQIIDHAGKLEWSALVLLKNSSFWLIVITIGMNFYCMSTVLVHIIPHAQDLGISAARAPFVLTASAGAGVLGKILFGYVADHWDARNALWLCILFMATGVALLLHVDSFRSLVLTGLIFGFGMGGIVPLWGTMIGNTFGRRSFGRVMGLMSPCMIPIHTAGVPLAGYIFDKTGSYDLAFKIILCVYAAAAILLYALKPSKVDHPDEETLSVTG